MTASVKSLPWQLCYGKTPERLVGTRAGLQLSMLGVEDRKKIVNFKLRIGTFIPQKNAINRSWMPHFKEYVCSRSFAWFAGSVVWMCVCCVLFQ